MLKDHVFWWRDQKATDSFFFDPTLNDQKVYDNEGFDQFGYDEEGFDRDGFDIFGINRWGFDKFGDDARFPFRDKDGYDREGLDEEGYDKEGYNREGYDKDGFDREGYDRYGYDREGQRPDVYSWKDVTFHDHNKEYLNNAYGILDDEVDDYGMPLYADDPYEDGPPEPVDDI